MARFAMPSKRITGFSRNEKAIIVGSILGDGHIQQMALSNQRTVEKYRLRVAHTKEHFDYLDWKHQQLKRLCSQTKPPYPENNTDMCLFYTKFRPIIINEIPSLLYKLEDQQTL